MNGYGIEKILKQLCDDEITMAEAVNILSKDKSDAVSLVEEKMYSKEEVVTMIKKV